MHIINCHSHPNAICFNQNNVKSEENNFIITQWIRYRIRKQNQRHFDHFICPFGTYFLSAPEAHIRQNNPSTMPKHRSTPSVLRRTEPMSKRDILQRQLTCVQRDKENNLSSITESSGNDSLLTYMKIEVKEEDIDSDQQSYELSEEIDIPLKIEQFETLEYNSITHEESPETGHDIGTRTDNKDLNILIEWALNLQFDHSKHCSGRLYPCKEILDNFRCKIVVLYCTVCKKRMLHTLKDWAML